MCRTYACLWPTGWAKGAGAAVRNKLGDYIAMGKNQHEKGFRRRLAAVAAVGLAGTFLTVIAAEPAEALNGHAGTVTTSNVSSPVTNVGTWDYLVKNAAIGDTLTFTTTTSLQKSALARGNTAAAIDSTTCVAFCSSYFTGTQSFNGNVGAGSTKTIALPAYTLSGAYNTNFAISATSPHLPQATINAGLAATATWGDNPNGSTTAVVPFGNAQIQYGTDQPNVTTTLSGVPSTVAFGSTPTLTLSGTHFWGSPLAAATPIVKIDGTTRTSSLSTSAAVVSAGAITSAGGVLSGTIALPSLSVGTHTLPVEQPNKTPYDQTAGLGNVTAGTVDASATFTVTGTTSISTITASPVSPAPAGTTSVALSATVTAADTTHPAGTAELFDNTTDLGAATYDSSTGAITATATGLTNGSSHSYTFQFAASGAGYSNSTSAALTYAVSKVTTSISTITASPVSPAPAGTTSVALSATVTAADSTHPAGTVELFDGATDRGAATFDAATGHISKTVTGLADGSSHSYTFQFAASGAGYSNSTSAALAYSVNSPVTTSISAITASPVSPAPAGTTSVALSADLTAADSTHPAGSVELFDGATDRGAATFDAATGQHHGLAEAATRTRSRSRRRVLVTPTRPRQLWRTR